MKKILLFITILILSSCQNQAQNNTKAMEMQKPVQSQTIYQFKVTDLNGVTEVRKVVKE
jgi:general stress protein 26